MPLVLAYPAIVGFGPMYVASKAPPLKASIALGPALNAIHSILVLSLANAFSKINLSLPTRAGAWVTLAKYPIRITLAIPLVGLAVAAVVAGAETMLITSENTAKSVAAKNVDFLP